MKKNILKSLMVTGAVLTVIGCGGGSTLTGEEVTVNTAPVAIPTADTVSVNISTDPNATVTLDGSTSTDADNDPITAYTWSLTPPAGSSAALSSTTEVSPTFEVDIIGSYVVSLIVSDGSDNSVSVSITITVTDPEAPLSILSPELKESIAHMYNEEGLAYDVYMNIYKRQAVNQLQSIATKSEIKHIGWVNELAIKYDLNITDYPDLPAPYSVEGIGDGNYSVEAINVLYDILYTKGIQSKQDALEVGCMVEVVDIIDLDGYIKLAEESNASDVLSVFLNLRNGSYNHYQQFDQGLKNMGVATGCCIVPAALGYDSFCNDEYLLK